MTIRLPLWALAPVLMFMGSVLSGFIHGATGIPLAPWWDHLIWYVIGGVSALLFWKS